MNKRQALKREAGVVPLARESGDIKVSFEEAILTSPDGSLDVVTLVEALTTPASLDPVKAGLWN